MRKNLFVLFLGFVCMSAPFAQEAKGEAPTRIESKPVGGFSKSISGTWDCGESGIMTLIDRKGKVTGKYSVDKGKISGTVKNGVFLATWTQAKEGKGTVEFQVSIERMTPEPTHLRGKWKKKGETEWQPSAWECERK